VEGGQFFYNRAANNFGNTRITNVYNKTVINNVTINRASFNGPGGIVARPTPQQLAVAREPHVAPTPIQLQHRQLALANPALRASVNHGRPAIVATTQPAVFKGPGVVTAAKVVAPYQRPATAPPLKPVAGVRPATAPPLKPVAGVRPAVAAHPGVPARPAVTRPAPQQRPAVARPAPQPRPEAARPAPQPRPEAARPAPQPRPEVTRPAPRPRPEVTRPAPEQRPAVARPAPEQRPAPRPAPEQRPAPRPAPEQRPAPRPAPEQRPAPRPAPAARPQEKIEGRKANPN